MSSSDYIDDAKKAAEDAQKQISEGISLASKKLVRSSAIVADAASTSYQTALGYLDNVHVYTQAACNVYQAAEDAVVDNVKCGLAYAAANPYTTYAATGTLAVLALPVTRRFLWRKTFGIFSSPESVVNANASKVETLKARTPELVGKADKLELELCAAEDEYHAAVKKLKSTRSELQRLSTQVATQKRTAEHVVDVLRNYKKFDASLPVRGEAADQAATMKSTHARVNKLVWRIAKLDL